jgi:hypothetical protein
MDKDKTALINSIYDVAKFLNYNFFKNPKHIYSFFNYYY